VAGERVKSNRDLIVWQKAMDMVVAVYQVTNDFPDHERFGLTGHTRKSAISVPSNIAEGHARNSTREFLHHLSIAQGSRAETETQLLSPCDSNMSISPLCGRRGT
jgi:four helix bundle protein